MNKPTNKWEQFRLRLFHILEIGPEEDTIGRSYDIINLLSILLNLFVSILYTFEEYRTLYGPLLLRI
ncbi:MAG: hypothetical protein IKK17_02155, partial [Oscillospiraceae bacterium]|nr:hypothetical protein [Oscillospiraceae bacterium]